MDWNSNWCIFWRLNWLIGCGIERKEGWRMRPRFFGLRNWVDATPTPWPLKYVHDLLICWSKSPRSIISHLDYCKISLTSLPAFTVQFFTAVRIFLSKWKSTDVKPLFKIFIFLGIKTRGLVPVTSLASSPALLICLLKSLVALPCSLHPFPALFFSLAPIIL